MNEATHTYVILDNIRSAHNVGAIFRTADGAGVKKIFLCGITPSPIDRFGRKQKEIHKTALGAEDIVEWEYCEKVEVAVEKARAFGARIVSVEQTESSIPYTEFNKTENTAFVFGNEIDGVSKEVLEESDVIVEIPMHGKKESLNVSVSVGVILFGV